MPNPPAITLTTDFGHHDPYVGVMKGAILSVCPVAQIVDLCHEIEPFVTDQAAFVISQAVPYFPPDTVHMVVVDPGVGGPRRALVAKGKRACYVGPDNGVLGPLFAEDEKVVVHEIGTPDFLPGERSATFHGRDLFSPAAAHLAMGRALSEFGPRVTDDLAVPFPAPAEGPDGITGTILHVDRFGNLITSLDRSCAKRVTTVRVGGRKVPMVPFYGHVKVGQPGALVGSSNRIEVFIREGSAKSRLGVTVGDRVTGSQ